MEKFPLRTLTIFEGENSGLYLHFGDLRDCFERWRSESPNEADTFDRIDQALVASIIIREVK